MKAFYLISWPMRLVALQEVFLVVKAETKRGGKRRLEEKMCPKNPKMRAERKEGLQ